MKKEEKKKRGRPSLYKPEYCEAVIKHGQEGRPLETFGAVVGVHTTTIYDWAEAHEEFAYAIKMARVFALDWWLEKGRTNLIINPDEKFNATIWIFTLKSMFQLRDGTESKASEENPIGKAKEQLDQYKKEVEELREALKIRDLRLVR